jgi:uncharacterized membrane protein YbhN (UPF0104 family)
MAKSRWLDRLALLAVIVVFCAAIIVLVREFADVSLREVAARLAALPPRQLLAAAALTALSYLLLTGYDFLALRYVRRRLRARDVLFASFTSFAFANNVGVQILSGGSTRYRIYRNLGLGSIEIGAIVFFCTVAYALGVVTVGGLLSLIEAGAVAALLHLPRAVVLMGGCALLGASVAYLLFCALWRRPVAVAGAHLRLPSLKLAIAQVVLASVDAVVVSTVFYALLPEGLAVSYLSFLTVYLIAATASVLSLVPGGLGVFETAMTVLTAPPSKAAALSAYFAYRLIYFIAPLIVALVLFALHEWRGRRDRATAA